MKARFGCALIGTVALALAACGDADRSAEPPTAEEIAALGH